VSQQLHSQTLLPGELQAYQDVVLYPKVQGFVEWIEVDRGSVVKEGQLLVRLIAPELTAHRQEAAAKVQAAQAQRLEAEAKLAADEATYKRLKAASATPGVITGNDVDIAQKTAEADRARVHAGQENENAAVQAARSFQDIESYLHITTPFDGIITERNVHKGSLVGPSGGPLAPPMLRIQQVSSLRLLVAVPEMDIAGIEPGAEMKFTVPAFPGEYHKHDYPEMAVLCAARYATLNGGPERKWGWIHLDSITKDVIGEDLVSIAAEPDVWYYMTVSNGYGEARAEKSSDEI